MIKKLNISPSKRKKEKMAQKERKNGPKRKKEKIPKKKKERKNDPKRKKERKIPKKKKNGPDQRITKFRPVPKRPVNQTLCHTADDVESEMKRPQQGTRGSVPAAAAAAALGRNPDQRDIAMDVHL